MEDGVDYLHTEINRINVDIIFTTKNETRYWSTTLKRTVSAITFLACVSRKIRVIE